MKMSIWDIKRTSGSWDWTNKTLISSWHRCDTERYPAERNAPGSYTLSWGRLLQTSLYGLICNPKGHVLPVSRESPKDILIWFYNAKKRPRHNDFCMIVTLLNLSPQHGRLTIRKEGIRRHIFLSSNILSNSIWSLIDLVNFFHHNCLISL